MQMQASGYATELNASNIEKINKDNYRFYLPARIQCFKFAKHDFLPCSLLRCFI